MVTNEVDRGQRILSIIAAQATTQLLQEHHRGFSRRSISTVSISGMSRPSLNMLTVQIDLEFPGAQLLNRTSPRRTGMTAMHRSRGDSVAPEELSHEVGMGNGDAERESATTALVAPDVERMLGSLLRLDGLCEHGRVEPATPPRDWRVVNVIRDAKVAERAEVTALDAFR